MKARVVTVQIKPDKLDEAVSIFRDSVVPAASKYTGCHRIILATDRASGKGVSISVWDEQELLSSEASGYLQEQIAKFAGVLAAPPVRELYDLRIWERATRNPSHGRMLTSQLRPGQADAAVDRMRTLLPELRRQSGFVGLMVMTDLITGKALTTSAWASEADMLASQASGGNLERNLASVAEFLAGPPVRETFEISVRWARES
jgi:quinol monooxygenase YgiN